LLSFFSFSLFLCDDSIIQRAESSRAE